MSCRPTEMVRSKTGCGEVQSVDAGVRRYIGAASAAKVRQYALEGVRDLSAHPTDDDMHQRIYFHIRGRQATSVTLYLRAEKLPSLYYTELGEHTHSLDVKTATPDGEHQHNVGELATTSDGAHQHLVADSVAVIDNISGLFNAITDDLIAAFGSGTTLRYALLAVPQRDYQVTVLGNKVERIDPTLTGNDAALGPMQVLSNGSHQHKLNPNQLTVANDPYSAHTHAISSGADPAGVTDSTQSKEYTARAGDPLTYVADLQIWIDGADQTDNIKRQLQAAIPTEASKWNRIGDGSKTHPLVTDGTRAIKLDFLPGLFFAEGEHSIELRLPAPAGANPAANGGRINYNLYVE